MAGESETASRQRPRVEVLGRSAELSSYGDQGAEATGYVLACLPAHEWTVLDDIHWPSTRWPNVDQVAIGPSGVYVVDARHWLGRLRVRDGVLVQNRHPREDAVAAAADAALAVADLLGAEAAAHVQPVLCFVRDEWLVDRSRDVLLCSTASLEVVLRSRREVLAPDERRRLERALSPERQSVAVEWMPLVPRPRAGDPAP